jgi:hypothetical protein
MEAQLVVEQSGMPAAAVPTRVANTIFTMAELNLAMQ